MTALARWLVALLCALCVVSASAELSARPGAGHSYSGSSRSSSSSSSSGSSWDSTGSSGSSDGDVLGVLVVLAFEHPSVGVPLLFGFLIYLYFKHKKEHVPKGWDSGGERLKQRMQRAATEVEEARHSAESQSALRAKLERLRRYDDDFSLITFEDFLDALYREAHLARGKGTLDRLSPFLSEPVRRRLAELSAGSVDAVVVGALRLASVRDVEVDTRPVRVGIEIEANTTETKRDSQRKVTYYVHERWVLERKKSARSRPPERARVLDCPNCGAPTDRIVGRVCGYCQVTIDTGEHDWLVTDLVVLEREARPPALTGTVEERGTELPTVVDAKAEQRLAQLFERDPELEWPGLRARVELIFGELQKAWNERDLEPVRGFLSDNLFESWQYWVETYRREKLRNVTDGARIVKIEAARVSHDKYYDAITVRVFATGLDFTLDETGKVVGGSKKKERRYSEYWTLIRGRGAKGAPKSDLACPSCGGPLQINMAGLCQHCQVKVNAGQFDWVLSRVDQDESY